MVHFLSIIFFLDFFNFCWGFQNFPFFCVTLYIAKDKCKYFCVQTVRCRKYAFKSIECKINKTPSFYKAATCLGLKFSRHQAWEERYKKCYSLFQ